MSKRVLIVGMSPLEDVINALPVLNYLHASVPGIEIDWVVEEENRDVLEGHPLVRRLHMIRTRAWSRDPLSDTTRSEIAAVRHDLHEASYYIAFDLQGDIKSGIITWLSGTPRRYGFDRDGARKSFNRFFTTNQVPLRRQDHHLSHRFLRLVSVPLGRDYTGVAIGSDIYTSPDDDAAAEALLATLDDGLVFLFHNGATWTTRLWHEEGWIDLGKKMLGAYPDSTILFSWGNEQEKEAAEAVATSIGRGVRVLPTLSLKGLCALLKKVDLVVGGDTGPIHMAAAVGTPTVSFYRATDGKRNGPLGDQHVVIQSSLDCTACLRTSCDKDAPCRASITADVLMSGIEKLLTPPFPSAG